MDDKLSIRVNVADRYYPLKVERENEEKIRKAARMINEKVLQSNSAIPTRMFRISWQWQLFNMLLKLTEDEDKLNDNHIPEAIKRADK
jgi:cell division protein ZapA